MTTPMSLSNVAFIDSSSYALQEELRLRAKSWRAPLDRLQGIVDADVAGDRSEGVGCNAGTASAVVDARERCYEYESRRLLDSEPVERLPVLFVRSRETFHGDVALRHRNRIEIDRRLR